MRAPAWSRFPCQRLAATLLLLGASLALSDVLANRQAATGPESPRFAGEGAMPGDRGPSETGDSRIDLGPPDHNCRFWGMVGRDWAPSVLEDQLRGPGRSTLRTLGGINRDGWGFAGYPSDSVLRRVLGGPLVRRGGPPADNPIDPNFDAAVDEIQRMHPRALLGHVRIATSGHSGIPNPHPFLHGPFAFAHNGGVSVTMLRQMIDGEDPGYLVRFPPEYVSGNIDSEIYFLWLMCRREHHPELSTTEAVRKAVADLRPQVGDARLNFVMTQGDTLFVLRCAPYDESDAVRYFPADDPVSPFWIAASQPVGTEGGRWGAIPEASLAVFVPGHAPSFYPIETPAPPEFSFRWIGVNGDDGDGDGHVSRFTVAGAPEITYGLGNVRLRVERVGPYGGVPLGESGDAMLCAGRVDTLRVAVEVTPGDLAPQTWSLRVELVDPEAPGKPLAVAGEDSDPAWGLSALEVEGAAGDTLETSPPPSPPPPADPGASRPWPNPSRASFTIPVGGRQVSPPEQARQAFEAVASDAPKPADEVSLEIRDAGGRLVYEATGLRAAGEPPAVSWSGLDMEGRRVAAGTYFCRVHAAGGTSDSKLTVLR